MQACLTFFLWDECEPIALGHTHIVGQSKCTHMEHNMNINRNLCYEKEKGVVSCQDQ